MKQKRRSPTEPVRISKKNTSRLYSLAGRLQDRLGKKQTLDDAIDYLFDNLEKKQNEG